MAKLFITLGIVFLTVGILMHFFNLFKLPGDIYIQKENFSFYFPITSSIIISIIFTIISVIISRFF